MFLINCRILKKLYNIERFISSLYYIVFLMVFLYLRNKQLIHYDFHQTIISS